METESHENRDFAREIKFLLAPEAAIQVCAWARSTLGPDPLADRSGGDTYQISSLYFDTAAWDVFLRRGSYGRSKLRVRRYGSGETVFLERKLRTSRMLAKRRTAADLASLGRLTAPQAERGWPGWWFHRRLLRRHLRPVCQLRYQRMARVATTPAGLIRLTLDEDLRALPAADLRFSPAEGAPVLPDWRVLELKFRRETPAIFKYLVGEFALSPMRFSKYRHAAAALDLAPGPVDVAESMPAELRFS